MSKMGQELDRKLDENKYELYESCRAVRDRLQAAFTCNPDIDSAEVYVNYLYGISEGCQKALDKVIKAIEGK